MGLKSKLKKATRPALIAGFLGQPSRKKSVPPQSGRPHERVRKEIAEERKFRASEQKKVIRERKRKAKGRKAVLKKAFSKIW